MFEFNYDKEEKKVSIIPERTKDQYRAYVLCRIISLLLLCDIELLGAFWRVISWVFVVIDKETSAAQIEISRDNVSFQRIKKRGGKN